jgi:predicted O-methyltransferase YrrM
VGSLANLINGFLKLVGIELVRLPRRQVMPAELPDAPLYTGPEDYHRLLRPWRSAEFDRWFTPSVTDNTMLSRQKLYFLLRMVQQTLGVSGDVFEAGAGSGGSGRLMLDVLRSHGSAKALWLLDTFEGYQQVDPAKDGAHMQVNDCKCRSLEDVTRLLANDTNAVHLVKGLIPGTLAQVTAPAISFAHIDVNLHEPTKAALEFALERLSRGGVIVFDDYNWPATFGARQAIDEVCAHHRLPVISLPESTQAFIVKP